MKARRQLWRAFLVLVALLAGGSIALAQALDVLDSLNQDVAPLVKRGQFNEALPLALQALQVCEDTRGRRSGETAKCLGQLGEIYLELGQYEKAEAAFKRGLKIRKKVLGPDDPLTALSIFELGKCLSVTGRNAEAEPLLQQALAMYKRAYGEKTAGTVSCLVRLGVVYRDTGDYAQAETLLKRAADVCDKLPWDEPEITRSSLLSLGTLYVKMRNFTEAEPLLLRSLKISEKTLDAGHPFIAEELDDLGYLYCEKGDYAKAESYYQRALILQEKNPGPDHPDYATTLTGLATVYYVISDYSKAEPLFRRVLNIREKAFGSNSLTAGRALTSLANTYEKMGDEADARSLDERVVDIDEKVLGPEDPETAQKINNLAMVDDNLGDHAKAEALYLRALKIQENAYGPEHPQVAFTLNNLAAAYQRAGQFDRAEPLFKRCIEIDQKNPDPNRASAVFHLDNLAYLCLDMGNWAGAKQLAMQVADERTVELGNVLSFTSEEERLAYQERANPYSVFAGLSNAPGITLAILRNKGIVLDSLIEDHQAAEASQLPEDRARIEQLNGAKRELSELQMQTPKSLREKGIESPSTEWRRLASEIDKLEGELAGKVAGMGIARRDLTVTLEQAQAALPRHSVLIEMIRYSHYLGPRQWEKRYGAAVLPATGDAKWVCLGAAEPIETNIVQYMQLVRRHDDEAELKRALNKLWQQVWAPVEAALPSDTQTAIISPDAGLNFVSFATLLTRDDKFLAQKYSLRYVASGRDLLHHAETMSNSNLVVFANPQYSANPSDGSSRPDMYLVPLPNFSANAREIESRAKKWNWPVQVFTGTAATESRVRNIQSPHILHLATHGFLLPEKIPGPSRNSFQSFITGSGGFQEQVVLRNPMLRSGIALAGAQATLDAWRRGEVPPTDSDGILTAEEASAMDLKGTYLVVLSACDTGMGGLRFGEGVLGLRRGFALAGTQNLLMTLWPVLDKSTGEFMLDFYAALHRTGNAPQALAEVQKNWLIKTRKERGLLRAVIVAGAFVISSQDAR
jgi:tetratricopeptide (TPR) repeat protein